MDIALRNQPKLLKVFYFTQNGSCCVAMDCHCRNCPVSFPASVSNWEWQPFGFGTVSTIYIYTQCKSVVSKLILAGHCIHFFGLATELMMFSIVFSFRHRRKLPVILTKCKTGGDAL